MKQPHHPTRSARPGTIELMVLLVAGGVVGVFFLALIASVSSVFA